MATVSTGTVAEFETPDHRVPTAHIDQCLNETLTRVDVRQGRHRSTDARTLWSETDARTLWSETDARTLWSETDARTLW
ncbi:hypothetical protein ANANG_G00073370, partial [Anguilla anguilla]